MREPEIRATERRPQRESDARQFRFAAGDYWVGEGAASDDLRLTGKDVGEPLALWREAENDG